MSTKLEADRGYHFVLDDSYKCTPTEKIPSFALLQGFGENTSAHGISHVAKAKGRKKLFWIIFSLISVGWLLYYGEFLFSKFLSWPVAVLVDVVNAPELIFPAVTVCNMNPVRKSKLFQDSYLLDLTGERQSAESDLLNETETSNVSSNSNLSESLPLLNELAPSLNLSAPNGNLSAPSGNLSAPSGHSGDVDNRLLTSSSRAKRAAEEARNGEDFNNRRKPTNRFGKNMNERFEAGLKFRQYIADLEEEEKMEKGHELEDFILDCEYQGYECEMSNFYTFYNSKYGNCFIYNSGWNNTIDTELELSNRPGPEFGLSLIFNIDQDEYVGTFTDTAGVRVTIHSQDSMPFPEDEGIVISPGRITYVGLTKEEINRKSEPYGTCVDMADNQGNMNKINVYQELYPVGYTTQACLKTCIQKHLMAQCGCGDSSYPLRGEAFMLYPNISVCDYSNVNTSECSSEVMEKYKSGDLPCNYCSVSCVEGVFSPTATSGLWPANAYRATLFSQLAQNRKAASIIFNPYKPEKYKENFAKLKVYFEKFNFKTVTEVPSYTAGQFISDIGGILGLFIGFSALTVLEFVELLFDWIVLLAYKFKMRNNLKKTATTSKVPKHVKHDGPRVSTSPLPAKYDTAVFHKNKMFLKRNRESIEQLSMVEM